MAYVRAGAASGQYADSAQVLCAFPMAFEQNDIETLKTALETAENTLTALTGINWKLNMGIDESTAAARNTGDTNANIRVYLDMGGGSTDIAVLMVQGSDTQGNDITETIYSTSVAYAGSCLLAGYAGKIDSRTGKPVNSCLSPKTTLDVLRRRVREAKSADDILGDTNLFNKTFENVVKTRTVHFYTYISEYVSRMIAAGILDQRFKTDKGTHAERKFPENIDVAFFFLGNGWRFAARAADAFATVMADQIFKRAVVLLKKVLKDDTSAYAASVKKQFKGIPMSYEVPRMRDVPHSKAAVALGLLRAPQTKQSQNANSTSRGKLGILGWPTKVGTREIPWFVLCNHDGGPQLPGPQKKTIVVLDDDDAEPAGESLMPWYTQPLSLEERLDWPDVPDGLPEGIATPYELDENLNGTRGALKQGCALNTSHWFQRSAYEVMLERLFKPKLAEIA